MSPFLGCCLIRSRHVHSPQPCLTISLGLDYENWLLFFQKRVRMKMRIIFSPQRPCHFHKRLCRLEILLILLFLLTSNSCSSLLQNWVPDISREAQETINTYPLEPRGRLIRYCAAAACVYVYRDRAWLKLAFVTSSDSSWCRSF